jgi:branched-chain amino acid transport system permease protein
VLLDEPLAGLSGDGITVMIGVIRSVRALGVTVVIIEHTMQALLRLADRLVVLDRAGDSRKARPVRSPRIRW